MTDWIFTLGGITLILMGGYGMLVVANIDPFASTWLIWGQLLFLVSGIIWLAVLVPAQIRQARTARGFDANSEVPDSYWNDARRWLTLGVIATVPLVAATFVMVVKP